MVQIKMVSGRRHHLGLDQIRVSQVSLNLVHKESFYKDWYKSTNFLNVSYRKSDCKKAEGRLSGANHLYIQHVERTG